MNTTEIALPGAFCDWFDGTQLVQGLDDADPECKATREAYQAGRRANRGSGYTITVKADATVLRVLAEYARTCVMAHEDDPTARELAAARKVHARARKAYGKLVTA